MFTRRNLLKSLAALGVGSLLPGNTPTLSQSTFTKSIAKSVSITEPFVGLPMVFTSDVERYLNACSLAQKCLLHDDLLCGAIARYEGSPSQYYSYVAMNKDGDIDIEKVLADEVFVPIYKVDYTMTKPKSDKDYGKKSVKLCQWFASQENKAFIKLLHAAGANEQTIYGPMNAATINSTFRQIEQHDLVATRMIVGKKMMNVISDFGPNFYDKPSMREQIIEPMFGGHLWTAEIYVSNDPSLDDCMYILSDRDTVGAFAHRGFFSNGGGYHYDEYGMSIIQSYAVAKADFMW